jgi:hypothetical protein
LLGRKDSLFSISMTIPCLIHFIHFRCSNSLIQIGFRSWVWDVKRSYVQLLGDAGGSAKGRDEWEMEIRLERYGGPGVPEVLLVSRA